MPQTDVPHYGYTKVSSPAPRGVIVDDLDLAIVLETFGLNAWQWQYDALGRVVSAQSCNGSYQCEYDALGRRIWQSYTTSSTTETTFFLYGPGFEIELDEEGGVKAETAFGLLGPLARWPGPGLQGGTGAAIWYIQERKTGNVRSLVRVNNGQVEQLPVNEYDADGDMFVDPRAIEQPYGYLAGLQVRYEVGLGGYTNPFGGVCVAELATPPKKPPLAAVDARPSHSLIADRAPSEPPAELAGATNEDFSRREFNGNLAAKGFAQADVAGEIGGFVLESAPGSGLLMAGYGRDGRGRPISDCDRILEGVSVFPLAGAASRAGKAVKSGSEALSNLSRAAKKDLYSKLSSKYGLGKDRVKHILQRHYDQFVRLDPSITPDQVLDIGYNVGSRGANFVRRQADGRVVYQANLTIGSTQVRVTSVMEGHCLVTVFIND